MRTEMGAASIRIPCNGVFPAPSPAEIVCDELVEHTFVCETCINGHEDLCPVYVSLKQKVADVGGITKGILLTM